MAKQKNKQAAAEEPTIEASEVSEPVAEPSAPVITPVAPVTAAENQVTVDGIDSKVFMVNDTLHEDCTAFMSNNSKNTRHRNSHGAWWCVPAFKKLQDKYGVTADTINASRACVLMGRELGIPFEMEDFDRRTPQEMAMSSTRHARAQQSKAISSVARGLLVFVTAFDSKLKAFENERKEAVSKEELVALIDKQPCDNTNKLALAEKYGLAELVEQYTPDATEAATPVIEL